jgi:type III pantothenate kinase
MSLLAIDIGNTNISLGVFQGSRLIKRFCLATEGKSYGASLTKILQAKEIEAAVACSVVPQAAKRLEKELVKLLGRRPYYIGKEIQVPIKNLYRRPKQVGADRLVNAYAALKLYGAPAVVVDFGTAITFDVLSRQGKYLGGMILPGLQLSLDALGSRAALLPKIKLSRPAEFIGRDTRNSMLSGIVYGFSALTDTLVGRLCAELGKATRVIGTGGNIRLLMSYCRCFDRVNQDLTLQGLRLLCNTLVSKEK